MLPPVLRGLSCSNALTTQVDFDVALSFASSILSARYGQISVRRLERGRTLPPLQDLADSIHCRHQSCREYSCSVQI